AVNYTFNFVVGTLRITPAPLTITADNKSKVYSAPVPALTAHYTGFVNGETPASLTTLPQLGTTATATSDVVAGGYPITMSGAVSANYAIAYVSGILTVTPADQTIGWSNPAMITYGAPLASTQLSATV